MAKDIFVGINNQARKVKNLYIGINGKARKVVSGYCGVNGIAKQFWPGISTVSVPFNWTDSYTETVNGISGIQGGPGMKTWEINGSGTYKLTIVSASINVEIQERYSGNGSPSFDNGAGNCFYTDSSKLLLYPALTSDNEYRGKTIYLHSQINTQGNSDYTVRKVYIGIQGDCNWGYLYAKIKYTFSIQGTYTYSYY